MTRDEVIARSLAVHPWRPLVDVVHILEHCEREGTPFCAKCADWHHSDEEHSSVTDPTGEWFIDPDTGERY